MPKIGKKTNQNVKVISYNSPLHFLATNLAKRPHEVMHE